MTCSSTLKPGWSPMTIGLMVLGFIVFWPLGLAMLAYILWGDRFHTIAGNAREQWQASPLRDTFQAGPARTGNSAFDAYRERELKRLEEERQRLEAMRAEFDSFLRELRKAKDQEEFDRFMASRGRSPSGPETI